MELGVLGYSLQAPHSTGGRKALTFPPLVGDVFTCPLFTCYCSEIVTTS